MASFISRCSPIFCQKIEIVIKSQFKMMVKEAIKPQYSVYEEDGKLYDY
jgi:hypothetical protein